MTMKVYTIGSGSDIKQLYIVTLRDSLGKPLGRDPFRGDPVMELVCHRDM